MSDKTKILVAEDNDFVRMQIVRFLQEAGFETLEAIEGQEALDLMDDSIHIAIADVRMEPMDGFEFIRAIRGRDLETPVILVTGDQNPELLHQASTWGVAAVLMKPVERERLIKTVERVMRGVKT